MSETHPVRPPTPALQVMEAMWLPLEATVFLCLRPLLRTLGAGDQHPVLILPGFGASDESTTPLRWALRGQGYWVHAWGLGREHRTHGSRRRRHAGSDSPSCTSATGTRTVTLIGQSLGGIYARLLARESTRGWFDR